MTISRSTDIAASPDAVWALVSDLPAMGRFSPENTGGSWQGGAARPALGARFRGANKRGARRWSTSVVVSRCEPGRAFAFDVSSLGLKVANWSYDVEPTATGCRLTESWDDRRGRLVKTGGKLLTGVGDRESYAATSMEQTLAAVKQAAEQG